MNSSDVVMIIEQAENEIRMMLDDCPRVKSSELGLDHRCGRAYVGDDCLIIESHNVSGFDYFGGFEYIDQEMIQQIGRFVVYYAGDVDDNCRVRDAIDTYNGVGEEMEEVEGF